MLFDDPSSSSPPAGDARPLSAARARLCATPAPADPAPLEPPDGDHRAAGRMQDPRLIESAGAPAPEALRATAVAAAVVAELYESGREVRFAFVPTRNRVAVLLCDMDGGVLSRLTPGRALEIATGEPVPGTRRR